MRYLKKQKPSTRSVRSKVVLTDRGDQERIKMAMNPAGNAEDCSESRQTAAQKCFVNLNRTIGKFWHALESWPIVLTHSGGQICPAKNGCEIGSGIIPPFLSRSPTEGD
jgi:hypothetical protein